MFTALMPELDWVKRRLAAALLTMFIGLALGGVANAAGLVVSTGVIPLSGTVRGVAIQGWLHVVVQIPPNPIVPPNPIIPFIHANLPSMDVVVSDGLIARYGLFQLEDDRHYFPPYDAVPVVRQATLKNTRRCATCSTSSAAFSPSMRCASSITQSTARNARPRMWRRSFYAAKDWCRETHGADRLTITWYVTKLIEL